LFALEQGGGSSREPDCKALAAITCQKPRWEEKKRLLQQAFGESLPPRKEKGRNPLGGEEKGEKKLGAPTRKNR